jgi:hypothetical protein
VSRDKARAMNTAKRKPVAAKPPANSETKRFLHNRDYRDRYREKKPMKAKRQLVAEKWNEFARILPPGVSKIQRDEMRRAYYCGAQDIVFGIIAAFTLDSEPTAEDVQVMEDLQRELSDFADLVKAGRA